MTGRAEEVEKKDITQEPGSFAYVEIDDTVWTTFKFQYAKGSATLQHHVTRKELATGKFSLGEIMMKVVEDAKFDGGEIIRITFKMTTGMWKKAVEIGDGAYDWLVKAEEEKIFYVTFGTAQYYNSGHVKVKAPNMSVARKLAFQEFGRNWAFIYPEWEWMKWGYWGTNLKCHDTINF